VTFFNGSVTCETWDQCNGGILATFCTITGQGHQWPGASSVHFKASGAHADGADGASAGAVVRAPYARLL